MSRVYGFSTGSTAGMRMILTGTASRLKHPARLTLMFHTNMCFTLELVMMIGIPGSIPCGRLKARTM